MTDERINRDINNDIQIGNLIELDICNHNAFSEANIKKLIEKNGMHQLSYIEHEGYVLPTSIPWNITMVNAPAFWDKTKGGGRVIAIVDTGLNVNHSEFTGRIYDKTNCTGVGAYNDVTDNDGHGTHVAGTAAGTTVGVAPKARIWPLKVFGGSDVNGAIRNAFVKIIEHNKKCAEVDKVVAVNCSFGSTAYDAQMAYHIRTLVSMGVVVCVAAGNSGDGKPDTEEVFSYPAYISEVLTTASINQDGSIAYYSNSFDGIDIAAPGTYIYSAWKDGGYNTISGTSMATPHITGTIALLADKFYIDHRRLPVEGEMDNLCPFFPQANGEIFKHIKTVNLDDRLMGMGILDLSVNLPSIGCREGYMWLNNKTAVIDGVKKEMRQPLAYDASTCSTLAPVRFVCEQAGFEVGWNQERQEVHFKR